MILPLLPLCFLYLSVPSMPATGYGTDAKSVVNWLTEKEHDFGNMKQGRPQVFVFKFRNAHADTISLQTVRTSCGCTAANWTEVPVAPGAEGEVRIEYDAYQGGDFDKKIRVFFDRQRKPEVLRIRGTVE